MGQNKGVERTYNVNTEKRTNDDRCHATDAVCNLLFKGVVGEQHESSIGFLFLF